MNEKEILTRLYEKRLIKTWCRDKPEGWVLISGIWSPFYIQLRNLPSYPDLLNEIGLLLGKKIKKYGNKLLGIAMAGIPIGSSISLCHGVPLCYTRKLGGVKNLEDLEKYVGEYGEHSMVEGEIIEGDEFIAVDDIVTKFNSKLVALKQLEIEGRRRHCKIKCKHIAVVIDRQQGAENIAAHYGLTIHSLLKFGDTIQWIEEIMSEKEYEIIKDYLHNSDKYQDRKSREEIFSSIS